MTLILENETEIDLGIDYEKIGYDVIDAVLNYVDCPYECVVNILLTDNEGIHRTNKEMRNVDQATDVLSFPGIPFETEGDFSIVESNTASYFDSESGELLLGDILISLEKVKEQALSYNHSVKREYAFLIAHSMLHLSGYDHIKEDERGRMEQLQDDILNQIGLSRDCE
ncbi:MAG: rRNA maturation RNase YbeY [Lachnospiraceae bacterium]